MRIRTELLEQRFELDQVASERAPWLTGDDLAKIAQQVISLSLIENGVTPGNNVSRFIGRRSEKCQVQRDRQR